MKNARHLSTASWVPLIPFTHVQRELAAIFEGFHFVWKNFFVEMADKGSDSGEEEDPTIAEDVVVTKYKMAGDMANRKY